MALKKNNNRMIILCGGRGRRMGKLTSSIPKPMVKIGKSSIIEHKIKYYQSQGIENFTICLGSSKTTISFFIYLIIQLKKDFFQMYR